MDFAPLSPLRPRKPKCVAKAKKSYAVFKTLKADSPSRSPLASPSRITGFHDLGSPTKKKSRKDDQDKFQAQLERAVKENAANRENDANLPSRDTPKKSAKGAHLKRKASEIMIPNDKMGKRLSSCGKNVRRNSQQFATSAWNYGRQNLSKALAMRQKSALAMDPAALRVFGKPIEDIMNIQHHIPCLSHLVIPVLVHDTVAVLLKHGLSVEGIFRISGSLKMMEGVVARLNSGELPDIEAVVMLESGVNVVSGLLKKFLRELPEPLMTFSLFEDFVDLFEEKEDEMAPSDIERIELMQALLEKLPTTNYYVLKQLTYLFGKISANDGETRMTADNIAIVMGPNLLKNPIEDPLLVFHEVEVVKNVVKFLIQHVSILFNYDDECIVNYETTMGADIDIRASYRNPDDPFDGCGLDSESDVSMSEKCQPEERPIKKRKLRKSTKSIFKKELLDLAACTPLPGSPGAVSPSTYNLASSTPLPPSPVKPGLRELADQTPLPPSPVRPGLRELADQTPLPVSPVKPGVREQAEQTPLPASPLKPGVREQAERTPLPASPLKPGLREQAERTPLPVSPLKPGVREQAERTPLPASPLKPGLREQAERTPLPVSPLKPGMRERAERTPLPVSPLKPGVREQAERTPLPVSPLKPGMRERAERTPLPVSPLKPGLRERAEQTPLPVSPLKPGVREQADRTPLPVSPLKPGLREQAERTPLPVSPLKYGLRELAEQTPLPASPLKPGLRELADRTPLPVSPLQPGVRELAEQTPLPIQSMSEVHSLVRRTLKPLYKK